MCSSIFLLAPSTWCTLKTSNHIKVPLEQNYTLLQFADSRLILFAKVQSKDIVAAMILYHAILGINHTFRRAVNKFSCSNCY